MVIFHGYVSLPEGTSPGSLEQGYSTQKSGALEDLQVDVGDHW